MGPRSELGSPGQCNKVCHQNAYALWKVQTHSEGRMSEPRTIKKYPNRRLYDTVESRYITLADIRRLVLERIDFVVVDKKSQ